MLFVVSRLTIRGQQFFDVRAVYEEAVPCRVPSFNGNGAYPCSSLKSGQVWHASVSSVAFTSFGQYQE